MFHISLSALFVGLILGLFVFFRFFDHCCNGVRDRVCFVYFINYGQIGDYPADFRVTWSLYSKFSGFFGFAQCAKPFFVFLGIYSES